MSRRANMRPRAHLTETVPCMWACNPLCPADPRAGWTQTGPLTVGVPQQTCLKAQHEIDIQCATIASLITSSSSRGAVLRTKTVWWMSLERPLVINDPWHHEQVWKGIKDDKALSFTPERGAFARSFQNHILISLFSLQLRVKQRAHSLVWETDNFNLPLANTVQT